MESHSSGSADLVSTHIIRTETVISKLPIHQLAKRGGLEIAIIEHNADGDTTLRWEVSYNSSYGPPQQLAYKLDTLVVNRCIDAIGRPLPKIIRLGSLRDICLALGLAISGRATTDVKYALHQNAGTYITAYLRYKSHNGTERSVETGFTRYSVIFTGQRLPNGVQADAVHLLLNDPYWEVLNYAPVRPLDYQYLTTLTPTAQRFYELLSYKFFAALKYGHEQATMRYSAYCVFAPQQRYFEYTEVKKQMYKVHKSHLESGYLAKVSPERVLDDQGCPDWILSYTPGPKAHAEYDASNGRRSRSQQLDSTSNESADPEVIPIEVSSDSSLTHVVAQDFKAEAALSDKPKTESRDPATALIQQFHHVIHGVDDKTPHPKEIERATCLIEQHGENFGVYFVNFACKAARQDDYEVQVFGGLMRYEGAALAAYRSRQARQAKASAEAAEAREMELRQEYRRDCQADLAAYEAGLDPEALANLKEQIRTELIAREDISRVALGLELRLELDERLSTLAGLPSFEAWLSGQNATARAIHHENAQPIVGVLGKDGK